LSKLNTDEEVREALTSEATLDILGMIGYRSIPQKETVKSVKAIIQ
jgi:hypothetical protein